MDMEPFEWPDDAIATLARSMPWDEQTVAALARSYGQRMTASMFVSLLDQAARTHVAPFKVLHNHLMIFGAG